MVTRDAARIRAWLAARAEPLIVKPVDGHGGKGIFLLAQGDRNVGSILEGLTEEGTRWVMAQAYLPAARQGDKRIILVDGEPLGAILRVPRGTITAATSTSAAPSCPPPSPRDREICAALGPRLRADGLSFVGIDVIGDHLTEST
ncbi:MAG: hypothetical protein R3F43_16940 [bacterium]